MSKSVYLDHNASAPLRPEAMEAIESTMRMVGNGSSVHAGGRAARKIIEDARRNIARLCAADSDFVTFTSGGTEANNLALSGTGRSRVLISAVEHPSVREAYDNALAIPVTSDGIVDLGALEDMLKSDPEPALVSVMYANNETGVIQPVEQVSELARHYGALVHCDAVQAAGKIPLDVKSLGVHLMSISAHKIGGPAGSGVLINMSGVELSPMFRGGGQEKKVRSGTENLIGIAGFGAAAEVVCQDDLTEMVKLRQWRDDLEATAKIRLPGVKIVGNSTSRLPNTSCLVSPGIDSETQVMAMDLAGIYISAGAACSSGKVGANPVMAAMGFSDDQVRSVIRVSLGWSSKQGDVETFLDAWCDLHERTMRQAS